MPIHWKGLVDELADCRPRLDSARKAMRDQGQDTADALASVVRSDGVLGSFRGRPPWGLVRW